MLQADSSSVPRKKLPNGILELHRPPHWYIYKPALHLTLLFVVVWCAFSVGEPVRSLLEVAVASQILALYVLMHQAAHGSLTRNLGLNEAIGSTLALMLATSFTGYRACHMAHHKSLRKADDPQEVVHTFPDSRAKTGALLVIASCLGAAVFIWLRVPIFGLRLASRGRVVIEWILALSFQLLFFGLILPRGVATIILTSAAFALIWGSAIDITYHQGLPLSGGPESSRSFRSNWLIRGWVLNGENWHLEHHVYPGVPGCNLRKLSDLVHDDLASQGGVYEAGYFRTFLNCFFRSPVFLPPKLSPRKGGSM